MKILSEVLNNMKVRSGKCVSDIKKYNNDFEVFFAKELDRYGLNRIEVSTLPKDLIHKLKEVIFTTEIVNINHPLLEEYKHLLPNNSYIAQPFNTQSYPDIIVLENDVALAVELKKTASTFVPVWNGGAPKRNSVYVHAVMKSNDITFFMGQDKLEHAQYLFMEDTHRLVKDFVKDRNKKMEVMFTNEFSFKYYPRKAINQTKKTDFKSNTTKNIENKTFEFLSNLVN